MLRSVQMATLATLLVTFSLYLWRNSFTYSDWAFLSLIPLTAIVGISTWGLSLALWKARLDITLREESIWKSKLSGRLRATLFSTSITIASVTVLAWQALSASIIETALMLTVLFAAALSYAFAQDVLLRHLRQPFARALATSLVTWSLAVPATILFAVVSWNHLAIPGRMLDASLQEALQIGLMQLPPRDGLLSYILSIMSGYEAAKIWVVVQLRDYPILGWLFSFDEALFSFILCRTGITVAQFIEKYVLSDKQK